MIYEDFLRAKVLSTPDMGIIVDDAEINPILKPHQRAIGCSSTEATDAA